MGYTFGHWHVMPLSLLIPILVAADLIWRKWCLKTTVSIEPKPRVHLGLWLSWIVILVTTLLISSLDERPELSSIAAGIELVSWSLPFWLVVWEPPNAEAIKRHLQFFSILAGTAAAISGVPVVFPEILTSLLGWETIPWGKRSFLPLGVATAIADMYLLALPVSIAWASHASRRLRRSALSGLSALIFLGAGLTYSRGAVALILAEMVILLFVGMRKHWFSKRFTVILILSVCTSGLITGLSSPQTTRLSSTMDSSILWRLRGWRAALTMIEERPLLGHGIERHFHRQHGTHSTHLFGNEMDAIIHDFRYVPREPHNMFLLMASEIGVIGTILYMALPIAVIVSLLRVYRSASQDLQIWLYAGAIGLSAVMIHGLVESNIVARHRIAMMFWMISGLLLGLATQHRQEVEHSKTP